MTAANVLAQYGGTSPSWRNRIINGACVIDQRNAGSSITPTIVGGAGTYTLDRWNAYISAASKFSVQQSTTAPAGFVNSLKITSLAATTVSASDFYFLYQAIEGFNVADLNWGTANAKTVTLSAWVYSSLSGTFGGSLNNSAANRSYPFTYSIPVANTWTQISVTIAGDTTGTWLTNNGSGIQVNFGLGCGSTYSGTAGAWAAGFYPSATGATSVVGTNGATFYITGVQLEVGTTATNFDYRSYGTELALCQRYYWKSIGAVNSPFCDGYNTGGGYVGYSYTFPVTMRTAPTVNKYGTFSVSNVVTQPSSTGVTVNGFTAIAQVTSTGRAYFTGVDSTTYFDTSGAEL